MKQAQAEKCTVTLSASSNATRTFQCPNCKDIRTRPLFIETVFCGCLPDGGWSEYVIIAETVAS